MTALDSAGGLLAQPPWLHPDSGGVRFDVTLPDGTPFGAVLSREVLRYRYLARSDGSDAVALYEAHRAEVDAAVLRRVAAGSREPVILRENDLPAQPRP